MQARNLIHRNPCKRHIRTPDKLVGHAARLHIRTKFFPRNNHELDVLPTAKIFNHIDQIIRVVAVQNGVKKKYAVFHRV